MDYKVIHGGYMNTLKRSSLAILSLGLLLSAPAHAGFADLYAQAGQAAQNLWAKRSVITNALPSVSMPKLSMPAISLPAVSLPKISMPSMPQVSMPSRAQVEAGFETFAEYLQKAEGVMAQYPKTVAATKMAAKVVPVVLVGGYLAKKAVNKYNDFQTGYENFEESLRRANRTLDIDLIGGSIVTAVDVMQKTQAQLAAQIENKTEKVPGFLNCEGALTRYLNIYPDFLPEVRAAWNNFIKLSIAHDNAKDNRFAEDMTISFERFIERVKELNALANGQDLATQEEVSAQQVSAAENAQLIKRVIGG